MSGNKHILSHALVAITALGVGYAAAPASRSLSGFVAGEPRDGVLQPSSPAPLEISVPERCQPWVERVDELTTTVAALQEELLILQQRPPSPGAPLLPDATFDPAPEVPPVEGPPDWEERLGEARLLTAFRQAVAQSGLDVELASADCTEYPCILYGHTADDPQILEEFLTAPAFEVFSNLERRVFAWGRAQIPDREEDRRYFGLTFFEPPEGEPGAEDLAERLQLRAQLMWDAVDHGER